MSETSAVPLAAKRARSEVPQLEVTALAPLRLSAVCSSSDLCEPLCALWLELEGV